MRMDPRDTDIRRSIKHVLLFVKSYAHVPIHVQVDASVPATVVLDELRAKQVCVCVVVVVVVCVAPCPGLAQQAPPSPGNAQLLLNGLSNACKLTTSGSITIKARCPLDRSRLELKVTATTPPRAPAPPCGFLHGAGGGWWLSADTLAAHPCLHTLACTPLLHTLAAHTPMAR